MAEAASDQEAQDQGQQASAANELVLKIEGASYTFHDEGGAALEESSDSAVSLGTQLLTIESQSGERKGFGYRDISSIGRSEYSAKLVLSEGYSFELRSLGEKYDDFMRLLYALRNDQYVSDLLIDEGSPTFSTRGRIAFPEDEDDGEIRVYKTRLGFFQDGGRRLEIARLSEITSFAFKDYEAKFSVQEDRGARGSRKWSVTLSQLGESYDAFVRSFQSANRELQSEISSLIRGVCPTISFTSALKLSKVLLDGRTARLEEVRNIAPDFAKSFEAQIGVEGSVHGSIEYLLSLGDAAETLIGAKKFVSDYLFLLIPIRGKQIVAFESNEKGHATYFFRATLEEMTVIVVAGLREGNFRREPIYLSENDLLKPQYQRYNHALKRLDSLRELRSRFIGRAFHSDFETWKSQTDAIVSKN